MKKIPLNQCLEVSILAKRKILVTWKVTWSGHMTHARHIRKRAKVGRYNFITNALTEKQRRDLSYVNEVLANERDERRFSRTIRNYSQIRCNALRVCKLGMGFFVPSII